MSYNRCGYCHTVGHNRVSCPVLKERAEHVPGSWEAVYKDRMDRKKKTRRCSFCRRVGHTKRTCEARTASMKEIGKLDEQWKRQALEKMRELGIGPGALLEFTNTGYGLNYKSQELVMVTEINWINIHLGTYEAVKMDEVLRGSKHFIKYDRSYINYAKPLQVFIPSRGSNYSLRFPKTSTHFSERFFDSESSNIVVSKAEVPEPPEWWFKNHEWVKNIL